MKRKNANVEKNGNCDRRMRSILVILSNFFLMLYLFLGFFLRSWDEFHACANVAMVGCPEEAASVWESLRQESKKMQFSGNLYDGYIISTNCFSKGPGAMADAIDKTVTWLGGNELMFA